MSVIKVFQTQSLYEEALERHSQYCRLYYSFPCTCLDNSGRPSISCTKCKGRGYRYYPNTERRRLKRVYCFGSRTITVEYPIKSINSIKDGRGNIVTYNSTQDNSIELSDARRKGEYLYVDYKEELKLNYQGSNIDYTLPSPILKVNLPSISTTNGDFVGEIVSITTLYNSSKGESITPVSYWDNYIQIAVADLPDAGDTLQIDCVYINPTKILLSDMREKNFVENIAPEDTGQLQATVPGTMDIAKGDIIVLLKSSLRASFIGNMTGSSSLIYQTPYFNVEEILRIEDTVNIISNAVLLNANQILFSALPVGNFSCTLKHRPTFVVDENPQPRNAENKIFPKKAVLKRMVLGNTKFLSPQNDNEAMY